MKKKNKDKPEPRELQELDNPKQATGFIALLTALAGVDPETVIPPDALHDNDRMAHWLYKIISAKVREPLEYDLRDVKAEVYDLTKSLRLANEDRDAAWNHNKKLKIVAAEQQRGGTYPLYCSEEQLTIIADVFEDYDAAGGLKQNALARNLSEQAYDILDEINHQKADEL